MTRPIPIPPEVVEAAAIERWGINEPTQWELETARIIIAAALAAWPGALRLDGYEYGVADVLHLPLPGEWVDE